MVIAITVIWINFIIINIGIDQLPEDVKTETTTKLIEGLNNE